MNIVQCGKLMYEKGYVCGTAGNISTREKWGVAVTASGCHLGLLENNTNHIVHVGNETKSGKPSMELPTHQGIYECRKDVNAIIHAHIIDALVAEFDSESWYAAFATEQSAYYLKIKATQEYHKSGSDESKTSVVFLAKHPNNCNVIIARQHGVFVLGKDLMEAFVRLEALAELAEFYLKMTHMQRR